MNISIQSDSSPSTYIGTWTEIFSQIDSSKFQKVLLCPWLTLKSMNQQKCSSFIDVRFVALFYSLIEKNFLSYNLSTIETICTSVEKEAASQELKKEVTQIMNHIQRVKEKFQGIAIEQFTFEYFQEIHQDLLKLIDVEGNLLKPFSSFAALYFQLLIQKSGMQIKQSEFISSFDKDKGQLVCQLTSFNIKFLALKQDKIQILCDKSLSTQKNKPDKTLIIIENTLTDSLHIGYDCNTARLHRFSLQSKGLQDNKMLFLKQQAQFEKKEQSLIEEQNQQEIKMGKQNQQAQEKLKELDSKFNSNLQQISQVMLKVCNSFQATLQGVTQIVNKNSNNQKLQDFFANVQEQEGAIQQVKQMIFQMGIFPTNEKDLNFAPTIKQNETRQINNDLQSAPTKYQNNNLPTFQSNFQMNPNTETSQTQAQQNNNFPFNQIQKIQYSIPPQQQQQKQNILSLQNQQNSTPNLYMNSQFQNQQFNNFNNQNNFSNQMIQNPLQQQQKQQQQQQKQQQWQTQTLKQYPSEQSQEDQQIVMSSNFTQSSLFPQQTQSNKMITAPLKQTFFMQSVKLNESVQLTPTNQLQSKNSSSSSSNSGVQKLTDQKIPIPSPFGSFREGIGSQFNPGKPTFLQQPQNFQASSQPLKINSQLLPQKNDFWIDDTIEKNVLCKQRDLQQQDDTSQWTISKQLDDARRNITVKECPICCEKKPSNQFWYLKCSHVFCFSCFRQQVEANFAEGKREFKNFTCLLCSICLDPGDLYGFLSESDKQKIDDFYQNKFVNFNCPNQRCQIKSVLKEKELILNEYFTTTCCSIKVCSQCKQIYHPDRKCASQIQEIIQTIRTYRNQQTTDNARLFRFCPSCLQFAFKDEKCNHVICIKCKCEFCFWCSAPRKSIIGHSNHFHRKGCPDFVEQLDKNHKPIESQFDPKGCQQCKTLKQPCIRPASWEAFLEIIKTDVGEEIMNEFFDNFVL